MLQITLSKKLPETYMKSFKENILRDNQLTTSSSVDNFTPSTSSSTDNSYTPSASFSIDKFNTLSSDTCIYDVGIVAILAIGACVFFAYNKKFSKTVNKEQVNKEQQQPIKQPKEHIVL